MVQPATLVRDVSPPPLRKHSTIHASLAGDVRRDERQDEKSKAAAIEAHEVTIRDHLTYFVQHLSSASMPSAGPRISIEHFRNAYLRNLHAKGAHFVVHQHDHPISGVHYDLRLQFSQTSSVSWAIPYGLPGNPNSLRPNRMAIETRVHNLWNNLIEAASHATGSLLIWDTGEYEVLERPQPKPSKTTDDEQSDLEADTTPCEPSNERLIKAFHSRHIHLRLHGSRLPKNYTIAMRLPSHNDRGAQPKKPVRKRRRLDTTKARSKPNIATSSDEEEASLTKTPTITPTQEESLENSHLDAAADASEDDLDASIRANNAYTGASNTIGSVHQRHWFVTLDRPNSGFCKARSGPEKGRWVGDWEAFYVRGREHERSIVTGRLADEVMADEGVERFVGRKMWRPIME
ncbi:Putative DNA ligase D, 3'-phosphoesterase domain-containing protein [Septoria linicola]|uniref:DNA ligase D, 3'-phosphoesterase domain-containing protein n=1 Tax=Septoria linicola TaxID=215465 RepID=A0A9Q9ARG7_9PEZI|nr:putative DNA ligase D, 3'-phosphoesterase domain-containing protein [Septoria linicola]USW53214.1 Putative DNA ligase D, 3'-phosphoesterase domain-containing protein [Septoria linicola]